ncbi:MAG: oligosaccharide flippase family protein [Pseudomonadota bacterium]
MAVRTLSYSMSEAAVDSKRFRATSEAAFRALLLATSRGAGIAAQMGVQIAVGALAGPAGIGILQLHFAWGTLLGEVVGAGEPTRALRDHSIGYAQGRRRQIARELTRSALRIVLFALGLFLVTSTGWLLMKAVGSPTSASTLLFSIMASAPLFALVRLASETLKAVERPLGAVALENAAMPGTILLFCAIFAAGWLRASPSNILLAAILGLLAALLGLLATLLYALHKGDDRQTLEHTAPAHSRQFRPRSQWYFWLNGLLNIAFLQLPFLLLPWIASAEEIGRYAVAHKLVNVITTLLLLMAAVYGPRFARAAAAADSVRLEQLLAQTQRVSMAVFLPTLAILCLCNNGLASLFSLEAGTLLTLLLILGAGQLINAATGLSGVLLNMAGGEHLEMRLLVAASAITALGTVPLARHFGVEGVAAAITLGIAARNTAAYFLAKRHIESVSKLEEPSS